MLQFPCYFFTGENNPEREQALRFWKDEFVKKHGETALLEVDECSDQALAEVTVALQSDGLFSQKRFIVFKNVPYPASIKKRCDLTVFQKFLSRLKSENILVFSTAKPDKRSSFYKWLSKEAEVKTFAVPKKNQLSAWISKQFSQEGKVIDVEAARYIQWASAHNINIIAQEIKKLCLLPQKELSLEDIKEMVSVNPEQKVFEILSHIKRSPLKDVLSALESYQAAGESMMAFVALMARQFRFVLLVSLLQEQSLSSAEIAKTLGMAPFQIAQFKQQVSCFTVGELKALVLKLSELDFQLKTGKLPISGSDMLLLSYIDQIICTMYDQKNSTI